MKERTPTKGEIITLKTGTRNINGIQVCSILTKASKSVRSKEKFEDIKGVIRSHTLKDRQDNVQKDKSTSSCLQNTTQSELGCCRSVSSSCSKCPTRLLLLLQTQ